MAKNKQRYADIFKVAAVSAAGALVGIIPQLLFGVMLLLIGIYLLNLDKKNNEKTNQADKKNDKTNNHGFIFYLGICLIILGSVISLNMVFGLDIVTSELFD